jgi:hypothetical protein
MKQVLMMEVSLETVLQRCVTNYVIKSRPNLQSCVFYLCLCRPRITNKILDWIVKCLCWIRAQIPTFNWRWCSILELSWEWVSGQVSY